MATCSAHSISERENQPIFIFGGYLIPQSSYHLTLLTHAEGWMALGDVPHAEGLLNAKHCTNRPSRSFILFSASLQGRTYDSSFEDEESEAQGLAFLGLEAWLVSLLSTV